MKKRLRFLDLSDVHLGHKNTPTEHIIENLLGIMDFTKPAEHDIIFFSGDVFDRLLDFDDDSIIPILSWLDQLKYYAKVNNIKIRVLNGTPSHDWNQSKIFEHYKKSKNGDLDIKFVDKLCVEIIPEYDLSVLYVPDEWRSSTDRTLKEAQDAVREMGLVQVDMAIMHGCFGFQLPAAAHKAPKHNEDAYLDLVKYLIIIGHDHTHKTYDRIVVPGSFDRLKHGEEEPKGYIDGYLEPNGEYFYFFRENKGAKTYVTVDIKSKDTESAIKEIEKKTKHLEDKSFVRIRADKEHPLHLAFNEVKKVFPYFNLSKITTDAVENDHILIQDLSVDTSKYIPITITKENLPDLLSDAIMSKHNDPCITDESIRRILADFI